MILIFRFFDFLTRVLSYKMAMFVARTLAYIVYWTPFYSRGRYWIIRNLRQAGISSNGLSNFWAFAQFICEFVFLPRLTKENLSRRFKPIGIERLEKEFKKGRGVVVLTAHLGNWEWGAAMLSLLDYPTTVIDLPYKSQKMTDFFGQHREKQGLKVVHMDNVFAPLKALKKGEIVAILGDRDYTHSGIEVDFFDRKVLFPQGPFYLAAKTGSPVIFAFAIRKGISYEVHFEPPIKVCIDTIAGALQEYAKTLERYILACSDQWYAFNRIWT